MEKIAETINGLQHIGLPTNDLEKTVAFYEGLGFSVALRTVNEAAGEQVAFLQLKELVIEAYQTGRAAGRAGAVDHIALGRRGRGYAVRAAAGRWIRAAGRRGAVSSFLGAGRALFHHPRPQWGKGGIQPKTLRRKVCLISWRWARA